MKLTEIVVCIAIFLLSSTVFLSSYVNMRKTSSSIITQTKNTDSIISKDMLIRNELQKIKSPYWKNIESLKDSYEEALIIALENQKVTILNVSTVYEEKHNAEGICVEWEYNGKKHLTKEFIKQRIIDDEK